MAKICVLMCLLLAVTFNKVFGHHQDPSGDDRSLCEPGYIRFQRSCYKFIEDQSYTWFDAHVLCNNLGNYLLTVTNAGENNMITAYLQQHNGATNVWLNINDHVNAGVWVYAPNQPIQFADWHSGRPINNNSDHCAFYDSNYKWSDAPCTGRGRVICEYHISNKRGGKHRSTHG